MKMQSESKISEFILIQLASAYLTAVSVYRLCNADRY